MISSSRKSRHVSDNVILWLWISCMFVTMVLAQDNFHTNSRFGKRKDALPMSTFISGSRFGRGETRSTGKNSNKVQSTFLSGSRFGRSESLSAGKSSKESAKLFEIVPRVDRFFYGSRYGKRSSSAQELRGAPPEAALDYRRFEAAIDYLDRVKQDLAEAEDLEEETRNVSRKDDPPPAAAAARTAAAALYFYPYAGRSKI